MKVSIITVVYNNKKTIEDTIKSVLNQTYKNIEYIIIDGASTDGTVDIIKSYEDKIDKFISEPDNGIYDAMNKGIKLTTGDIVGTINSDDFYASDNIIEMVMKEFKEKNIDSLYGDLIYIKYDNINKVSRYWKSSKFIKGSFLKGWHPPHPTFFVKKDVYNRYGLFDTSLSISADFEIMLRFLERYEITTTYLPTVLIKMREGGISNNSLKNILIGHKNIRKAFLKNGYKPSIFYTPKRLFSKILQKIRK